MDVRALEDSRSDAELVAAAMAGDRGAFAAIYDRYADRLHDFCWSLLRDRDEAADATQDAFLVAAERLGQLRDPERLRPWLYAVARSQALRRARARQRVVPEEEMIDRPDTAAGPERATEQADLRELVWNAAAGLSERDRALLDLHLRQGLEGAELGEAMGIPAGHAYVLLSRLRDQVERSLGALLVARLGRRDCPDLAKLLTGWDGRFSPLIRKRVARHVDDCDVCGERRRVVASPLALLAAVPPLPAPTTLRDRVLEGFQLTGAHGTQPPGQGPDPGGPTGPAVAAASQPVTSRTRRRVMTLAAAVVLAVAVGVALGWEQEPAGSLPAGSGSTVSTGAATSTSSPATTATTATTVPAAPGSLAVSPAAVDLGATRTTTELTLRNGGGDGAVAPGQPRQRPPGRWRAGAGDGDRRPRRPPGGDGRGHGRARLGRPGPPRGGVARRRAPPADRRAVGVPEPDRGQGLLPRHRAGPGDRAGRVAARLGGAGVGRDEGADDRAVRGVVRPSRAGRQARHGGLAGGRHRRPRQQRAGVGSPGHRPFLQPSLKPLSENP